MDNRTYEWYEKYYKGLETSDFNDWWIDMYGLSDEYYDKADYYIRKAFALKGWLACIGELK